MNIDFLRNLDQYLKAKQFRLVNSIIVYQNGELVFERYYNKFNENTANTLMSVWKSILSIAFGICLDNGLVKNIDEPIYNYLPQFAQGIDTLHKLITIRHLLTMSSGIYYNPGPRYSGPMLEQLYRSKDPVSHIADVQVKTTPGTSFNYKEWDTLLLSAIIEKVYGKTAVDVINEYVYTPLGINPDKWITVKCGICGVDCICNKMTAIDLAKIGHLMLNGGVWNGQRIVSEEYLKNAVSPSKSNNNYAFLWWLSNHSYYGSGYGGQELNVYPDKNIVAVLQATATQKAKQYRDICENIVG